MTKLPIWKTKNIFIYFCNEFITRLSLFKIILGVHLDEDIILFVVLCVYIPNIDLCVEFHDMALYVHFKISFCVDKLPGSHANILQGHYKLKTLSQNEPIEIIGSFVMQIFFVLIFPHF